MRVETQVDAPPAPYSLAKAERIEMQAGQRKGIRGRLTYANVMSTVAVFLALGGAAAFAADHLPKNSVGPRQIKQQAVTTGKLANNSVTAVKVKDGSLTGSDLNLASLGTVPTAATARQASSASTVDGHTASCPAGSTMVSGICYESVSNPAVGTVFEAADNCAAKGGQLPTPLELYSVRSLLDLGTGVGANHQYTDEVYANTSGGSYSTVVVDGTGAVTEQSVNSPSRYICVYPLLR